MKRIFVIALLLSGSVFAATPVGLIGNIVDMRAKLPAGTAKNMTLDPKTAKHAKFSHERTHGVEFEVLSWTSEYVNPTTQEKEVGFVGYGITISKNPHKCDIKITDVDNSDPRGIEFRIRIEWNEKKSLMGWTSKVSVMAFKPTELNLFND